MKKVSVVILNWNGAALLREFLPSVIAHTNSELADVIVADNGSTDDSIDVLKAEFPEVGIIQMVQNLGFAEGYNQALREVKTEYSVLLNSDVQVTPGWIEPVVSFMDAHPQTAACQPKVRSYRNPEYFEHAGACGGFIDHLGYPFCRGRLFHILEKDNQQHDTIVPIFWATGACLFIRTKLFYEVGGLDGDFFAHMEEIDLCWRLKSRGYDLYCIPQSTVFHLGAATLSTESPRKTYLNFRNNLLMLYKNLPAKELNKVLFIRFFLDSLAFFVTLIGGKTGNAIAIWKAVTSFYKDKKQFAAKRNENLKLAVRTSFPEIYTGSIVCDFYIKKKPTISL
jgi:Predicted glycosyltransferases